MSESEPRNILMYFLFFVVVVILSIIPYLFIFLMGPNDMFLYIDSIFYSYDTTRIVVQQLNLNSLLNMGIVSFICLYFMIYIYRISRNNRKQSQGAAIFFFSLVMMSLLVLDFEYFIQTSRVEHQYLSMFGLLLSYFTIVLYLFQNNSARIEFPDTTNRLSRKIMDNSTTLLGLLLLVLPFSIGISIENFNPDYPITLFSFHSSISSFGIINMPGSPTGSVFISILLGSSPIFFQFIFYWLPQIMFLILFLRYKSGYTTERWFGLGVLLSFIPWIVMFLFTLGSTFITFPLPILQIISYLVLVIEKNSKSVITSDSRTYTKNDEEFNPIVRVPFYKVIVSRMRKWGSKE